MLQDLISTFQQIFVGVVVTAASGAIVVIGGGAYRYLTRLVPRGVPKSPPEQQDLTEATAARRVFVILITGASQDGELLVGPDNPAPAGAPPR